MKKISLICNTIATIIISNLFLNGELDAILVASLVMMTIPIVYNKQWKLVVINIYNILLKQN